MATTISSPLEILLDKQNPRFIVPPNPTQEELRRYLIKRENILELMQKIIEYGGLMPGERIIVTDEEGALVSIEGNRRICACQLLLDPELIPLEYKSQVPLITSKVLTEIQQIEVDYTSSRQEAIMVLATRHIEGPKKWPPLSKDKFFANLFEAGKSVDEIAEITMEKKKDVTTALQEHYLVKYALELPTWTDQQKTELIIFEIKPSAFLRIFNTKGAREMLGLKFNPKTFQPESNLPKKTFDKVIRLIATATFIEKKIDTRSTLEDVPGLSEIIMSIKQNPPSKTFSDPTPPAPPKQPKKSEPEPDSQSSAAGAQSSAPSNPEPDKSATKPIPRPLLFFEGLSCTISNSDPEGTGILSLAKEIRDISTPYYLPKFPIAASMLLRTLFEQALKYHLKKIKQFDNLLTPNGGDPTLQRIINHIRNNLTAIFPDQTAQRLAKSIFMNPGLKDSLDLVIHHTNLVKLDSNVLNGIANAGLRALIENILTRSYP